MPSAAENVKEIDTKAMRYGYGDRVGRTNCHECNEGLFYDDNGDNLKLSFAGATEMPRIIFFFLPTNCTN